MAPGAPPIVFELGGGGRGLGPWQAAAGPRRQVAFSSPSAGPQAASFQIDLAADPAEAKAQLAAAEAVLAVGRKALEEAAERMDELASSGRLASPPSFAAGGQGPSAPDAELLAVLGEIQRRGGAVSIAFGGPRGTWDQATRRFREAMEELWQAVSLYARVETRTGGELVGQTMMGWTGDTVTVFREEVEPSRADLHRRAVALAIASRDAWIRAVAVAAQGAVKLATLLSVPGGALLALPVAWKYIQAIAEKIEQIEKARPNATTNQGELPDGQ